MANYRLIKDNQVINIIVADEAFCEMLVQKGDIDSYENQDLLPKEEQAMGKINPNDDFFVPVSELPASEPLKLPDNN